jgi:hypothetical protein
VLVGPGDDGTQRSGLLFTAVDGENIIHRNGLFANVFPCGKTVFQYPQRLEQGRGRQTFFREGRGIVDERFRDSDYRRSQNYVGQTVAWQRERVYYAAPKPTELPDMMAGMEAAHRRMPGGEVHPVVHAAVTPFGFVFMHPFEDGNGRIHRFLIHNILAKRGFTPKGMMFPVSAAMFRDPYGKSRIECLGRPGVPVRLND